MECEKEGCRYKAKWLFEGKNWCGVHCRNSDRKPIPSVILAQKERTKENAKRNKEHKITVEAYRLKNVEEGRRGSVCCNNKPHFRSKTVKDKRNPLKEGYLNVDVCSSSRSWKNLSPMYLGPVKRTEVHNGKHLPYAKNIENYWQFAKVYSSEYDSETDEVKEEYWIKRMEGYLSKKAYRRKFQGAENIPLFSIFEGKRYKYGEARKFYCSAYEELVVNTKEWKKLNKLIDDGYNIQIIGYDGVDIDKYNGDFYKHYKDTSIPFGHESVITCMLLGIHPWRDN